MNKITNYINLNLEQMAEDIYNHYSVEKNLSKEIVLQHLEKWNTVKYPIFEKFGRRLSIDSPIVRNEEEALKATVKEAILNLIDSKEKRIRRLDDMEKIRFYEYQLSALRSLSYENDSQINTIREHILKNKAILDVDFVYVIGPLFGFWFPERRIEVRNQVKLTKQISSWFEVNIQNGMETQGVEKRLPAIISLISEIIQAVKGVKLNDKMVLSIDPFDFVTASFNTLNWQSCFHRGGSYAKSAFVLLTDYSTAISYIPTSTFEGDDDPVFINNKKYRAFVHFDEEFSFAAINKVYPGYISGYTNAVEATLIQNKLFSKEEIVDECYYPRFIVSTEMYDDIDGDGTNGMILTKRALSEDDREIYIGEDVGCMGCGIPIRAEYESEVEDSDWECPTCKYGEDYFYCPGCEENCALEDLSSDENHCSSCYENIERAISNGESPNWACSCDICQEMGKEYDEAGKIILERAFGKKGLKKLLALDVIRFRMDLNTYEGFVKGREVMASFKLEDITGVISFLRDMGVSIRTYDYADFLETTQIQTEEEHKRKYGSVDGSFYDAEGNYIPIFFRESVSFEEFLKREKTSTFIPRVGESYHYFD